MIFPATVPIRARRNGVYAEEYQFTDGADPVDLTGYTGIAQVRLYGAQPGDAIISLPGVDGPIEGVWINDPAQGCVQIIITEATLTGAYAALRAGIEPGASILLVWDLVLTPPGGAGDEVWMEGTFEVKAGVTV